MFNVEVEQDADGRWLAEVIDLPSVLAYGSSRDDAVMCAREIALRVLRERLEHGEPLEESLTADDLRAIQLADEAMERGEHVDFRIFANDVRKKFGVGVAPRAWAP